MVTGPQIREGINMSLTGHNHRDAMKIRHHEHQQEALEQIRGLRNRIEETSKKDIASELDDIFKVLDHKVS